MVRLFPHSGLLCCVVLMQAETRGEVVGGSGVETRLGIKQALRVVGEGRGSPGTALMSLPAMLLCHLPALCVLTNQGAAAGPHPELSN